jgi:hypothetical protein
MGARACLKINQKNAMEEGTECGVGQLYSRASQLAPHGSCRTKLSKKTLQFYLKLTKVVEARLTLAKQ